MEDPPATGSRNESRESGVQTPRKHRGPRLVTSQVTDVERAGCLEMRLASGPGAVTAWGARAELVAGVGGHGWAGKRRQGEGEARALGAGALTALGEPRPAFLRAPGAERFPALRRSGARGRARARRGRACGAGMGASAARGSLFATGGRARRCLPLMFKSCAAPAQLDRAWTWWARL